jgi:hypothetical protein
VRRAVLCAVVVGCTALAIGATTRASSGLPRLLGDGPHWSLTWQVRPAHIVYTGDGSGVLGGFDGSGAAHPGHLVWRTWTTTRARGTGAVWIDDCTPDCARGRFSPYAVEVVAFRPIDGRFTRLTLTYTLNGKRREDRRGIVFDGGLGAWMYFIVGQRRASLQPVAKPPLLEGDLAPVERASGSSHRQLRLGLGVEVAPGEGGSAVAQLDPAGAAAVEGRR